MHINIYYAQGGVEIVVVLDPAHGTTSVEVEVVTDADTHGTESVTLRQQDHDKDAELSRRFHQRCESIGGAMELLHVGQALHKGKCDIEWQMPPLSTVCVCVYVSE